MKSHVFILLLTHLLFNVASSLVLVKKDSFLIRAALSQNQASLVKRDGNGTANLYSTLPGGYYITVNIGTQPQAIQLLLDTGSSNLIIPTIACPRTQCSRFQLFDPSLSSTFKNTSLSLKASYVKGNAYGFIGTDTVTIGGATVNNLTAGFVTEQTALSAGIFGLGFPSMTQYGYNPFFFQLQASRVIQRNLFSVFFDRNSNDINNKGEVIFGGIDQTKYTGNLASTAVLQQELSSGTNEYTTWSVLGQRTSIIHANGMVANTSVYGSTNGSRLLIDTGSSFSYFPQTMIDSILSVFQPTDYTLSSGGYNVACNQPYYANYTAQFSIGLSNQFIHLNIPLSDMIVQAQSGCVLGVAATEDYFILGLSVIHNFYITFDSDQHTISFAPAVGSSSAVVL